MMKNSIAFLTSSVCSLILSQTKAAATAIKIYSIVQTGIKIQLGGLKTGFSNVTYQVSILGLVTKLAEYPTVKQITKAIAIFTNLFMTLNFEFKNSQKKSLNHIDKKLSL